MDNITFAGLLGVGVGAIATIGTQGILGWLDRRNASRTAARLLYGDLLEARDIMAAALDAKSWAGIRPMTHVDEAWREHREAVARAVSANDFHGVAGAFKAIEFIDAVREDNAQQPDRALALVRPQMERAIPMCNEARFALACASCSAVERWITVRPKLRDSGEVAVRGR